MRSASLLILLLAFGCSRAQVRYFGKALGSLSSLQHGVRGELFAVDSRTLYLRDFYFDGEGPSAYFFVGTSGTPRAGPGSARLRDERGGTGPLRKYSGESITLTLPEGSTLKDYRWFSVYCEEYQVNFGDVSIPRGVEPPRPARAGALSGAHGVASDPIVVVDAQTLLVPHFSYDGEAPDAKFWVGRGDHPSPQGIRIPDENGKEVPLRRYNKKTIVLTLPGELTVFDIGHFGVWCEAFTVDFGHVTFPRSLLANVPPSLKMLGVSPQSKLNCEVLFDELAFEVRWAVAGDSIVIQLVAKLEEGEYMSFGISGDPVHSQMVGGDPVVAWVDKSSLKGFAVDYYLDAKSQCAGVRGSCPDERLVEGTNSVHLLNAALVNGYSIVTYQRSLRAADKLDLPVLTNASQPIIWAVGPLNNRNEVSYHSHFTKGDKLLEFGRPPVWNCPLPEGEDEATKEHAPERTNTRTQQKHAHTQQKPEKEDEREHTHVHRQSEAVVPTPAPVAKVTPWEIPAIQCYEPPDGVFYAQMGPTGGKQGYSAITGHVGWGISWFINGLLIPEINVVRGRKYTFVVEGGSDPDQPAKYHPFYITNDPIGGYYHKTEKEKEGIKIYAGIRQTRAGHIAPTGVGRLCNWTPDPTGPQADEYPSFGAYQRALTLVCEEGNPGVVTWVPDKNTPDTVYYQCFTHRHLGWKINVLDECDVTDAAESRVVEKFVLPDDMQSEESVQVRTRITPDKNFLDERKKIRKIINTNTNYDDFSNYKSDSSLTGEVYPELEASYGQEYELPITNGQIKEAIQAVEKMENQMKDDIRRNISQYQVHEEVKESGFIPEQALREDAEHSFDSEKTPDTHFMPPNQKPLTLQSVMRPNGPHKTMGNMRPPFHRPAPPEIKIRRPLPPVMYQKGNNVYPLPMPNHHNMHGLQKKPPPKYNPNRQPPNMNRPPPPPPPNMNKPPPSIDRAPLPHNRGTIVPPMKAMPTHYKSKPNHNQITKLIPKPTIGSSGQLITVVMGKPNSNQPSQPLTPQGPTMKLGQTDVIANQVVKSQIMLPGSSDNIAQHTTKKTFTNISGQIILGKPMDNPLPLDQQMTPTKQRGVQTSSTSNPVFQKSTQNIITLPKKETQNEIKSSDFIGESVEASSIEPAVNTGFKPDSIVVESGFKPIIREPLMAGEDRITDEYGTPSSNRREDTDVEEDYDEAPQGIANNHAYPSDKLTETFEPMFIPSPEDHLLPTNDKTKEVFPTNHAKEDRPHPVYVKTESELHALFSKKNMDKDVPGDLVMQSDRVSPHYLPPDPKLPKEHSQKLSSEPTFTTYDGKTVSAATLTSVPNIKPPKIFSSKLPANSEQLLKTPQFGPFKGEIPPPVSEHIIDKNSKLNVSSRSTYLKLVSAQKPKNSDASDLKSEASEIKTEVKATSPSSDYEYSEEYEEYQEDEQLKKRTRRNTKTTQFDNSVLPEMQTNGHSKPVKQVEFETTPNSIAPNSRPHWMSHIIILTLCMKML